VWRPDDDVHAGCHQPARGRDDRRAGAADHVRVRQPEQPDERPAWPGTGDAVTTSFTYESTFQQLASVTDPLSHTTTFGYDTTGQPR
jgi:hypothetical protein